MNFIGKSQSFHYLESRMYAEGDKNHYFPNYYDPCITAEHFIKYHSMNFSSRNPDLIPESAKKEQLPK